MFLLLFGLIQSTQNMRTRTPKTFVEKRANIFLCQELDVVAPAYDHFTAKLNQMKNIRVEYLYTSFKQFFCYERSKDMVLMKIANQ